MLPKLQALLDPDRSDTKSIMLDREEEKVLLRAVIEEEPWNIWAILMPAVYQLVPGSMIAKLWFNSLFPPSQSDANYEAANNVFANLMVISASLAMGLILGLALARTLLVGYGTLAERFGLCYAKTGT